MHLNSRGGAFARLFLEKQDEPCATVVSPTTGAGRVAGSGAGCQTPCVKNSLKEVTLQPDVWWLSTHILSFTSVPWLSSSVLSPLNCPCSRHVISSFHSPQSRSPYLASPVPIPLLSQPSSHCSAIPSTPCPVTLLCISSSPLFFHPFHPSRLTIPSSSLS